MKPLGTLAPMSPLQLSLPTAPMAFAPAGAAASVTATLGKTDPEIAKLEKMGALERRKHIKARLALMQSRFLPKVAGNMSKVFQVVVKGPGGGTWHTIVKNGTSVLKEGPHPDPSVVMTATAEDWFLLLEYKLHRIKAYLTGRIKIQGDRDLAGKFRDLYPNPNRPDGV